MKATRNLKWFVPGIHVKRWLVLMLLGVALMGLGVVYAIVIVYRAGLLPRSIYEILTMQFLSPNVRMMVAITVGALAVGVAARQLSKSVFGPFLQTGGVPLADALVQYRRRNRGPHIVTIGGGTGLSALLRGLKQHTANISAIITVADDGGSSGRLRRELGLLPPGDFRNCIAALSNDEALTTQLMQYRFGRPANGNGGELAGHSFGNLFIAAMTGITGSFEQGLEQSSQVLAIRGRILPSTLADVTLVADVREQSPNMGHTAPQRTTIAGQKELVTAAATNGQQIRRVAGESRIPKANGTIERVYLDPEDAPAYPAAVRAILTADLVVLGPGSLFTSVLPNLLIKEIRQALMVTPAPVVFVCNVANQAGETDGFNTADHLQALEQHIGQEVINLVLVNNATPTDLVKVGSTEFVHQGKIEHIPVLAQDLIDKQYPWRHDSAKLARAILSVGNY